MPTFPEVKSYTEVKHTVYCDVTDAPPMDMPKGAHAVARAFQPERITVSYHIRTQLGSNEWEVSSIEVSGPWIAPEPGVQVSGRGNVLLYERVAPAWVNEFVAANMPTSRLVTADGEPVPITWPTR